MKATDLRNLKIGRLSVVERAGSDRRGEAMWLCQCICGNTPSIRASDLKGGYTQSCGCLSTDTTRQRSTKHSATSGGRPTPEYRAWINMRRRCYDQTNSHFKDYGGRGIFVCDEWRTDFQRFIADMGTRPSKAHSIDRINNDGPYSPNNCRWATRSDQTRNQRNTRFVTLDGESVPVVVAAERIGIPAGRIYRRLCDGWSEERALSTR